MQPRQNAPRAGSRPVPATPVAVQERLTPDILGRPSRRAGGVWGMWQNMTVPSSTNAIISAQERELLRRASLLSALQLAAIVLIAILIPRGFLPVFDPGTVIGIAGFTVIVIISIILNRTRHVTAGAFLFVIGLAVIICGSQLFTPTGKISFADLAGYDLLAIPVLITGIMLPRQASIWMWLGCVTFVIVDLGLAEHSPSLDAFLAKGLPPFLSIYPVAIYPILLSAIVAVIAWLAAGSVEQALKEADRTADLEEAYRLLSQQNYELEEAIAIIQQVHSRVANGDLAARAPTISGNLLLTLAVSLNLMLERLMRSSTAQSTLENVEQQITFISQYANELGRGNLGMPLPAQRLGQLTPIANSLEQLRMGMLQVTRTTYSIVEQITTEANYASSRQNAEIQSQQEYDETTRQIGQSIEKLQQLSTSLEQYLRQFIA